MTTNQNPTVLFEVLNASVDDWEDLEQIVRLINFEYQGTASDGKTSLWRESPHKLPFADVVSGIIEGVTAGLLDVRFESKPANTSDLSFVWLGWFHPTEKGRAFLNANAPAAQIGST